MYLPGKILVVDDDRDLAFVLRAHFQSAGFQVVTSHSGDEALLVAQRELPDVILMDLELPGMNGLDVTRNLRRLPETANIPVIVITGRNSHDDVVLGLGAGAQDYVTKPFDVPELTARVRVMLKLSHAQREIDDLNERLTGEIQKKTARLERLYAFARNLNRASTVAEIYRLVVETVQQAVGCRRVSLMRYDPKGGTLGCVQAAGIDPKVAERVCIDAGAGIAGQVFSTGTTVVAKAVESTPGRYTSDAFLSTPLVSTYMMSGEQRLGVLNATDKPDGEPFSQEEIECIRSIADSAAIALHNVERRISLTNSIRALLLTVGRLSEYRDEETGLHLERVREYAHLLAKQLAKMPKFASVVTESFIRDLHQAAPLHDVGKVGIADEILNKPGKLTDEEYQIMKTHTTIGRHTLMLAMEETGPIPLLQMCVDIAYAHHERFDGMGYPRGLVGENIPLSARIIALVDAYDAMTSQRCYKKARPHNEVVEVIRNDAGSHFDPDVVEAFLCITNAFDRVRAAKADEIEPALQASATA